MLVNCDIAVHIFYSRFSHKVCRLYSQFILALKVILLDRLQGINCSVIQEPYLLGFML